MHMSIYGPHPGASAPLPKLSVHRVSKWPHAAIVGDMMGHDEIMTRILLVHNSSNTAQTQPHNPDGPIRFDFDRGGYAQRFNPLNLRVNVPSNYVVLV